VSKSNIPTIGSPVPWVDPDSHLIHLVVPVTRMQTPNSLHSATVHHHYDSIDRFLIYSIRENINTADQKWHKQHTVTTYHFSLTCSYCIMLKAKLVISHFANHTYWIHHCTVCLLTCKLNLCWKHSITNYNTTKLLGCINHTATVNVSDRVSQ